MATEVEKLPRLIERAMAALEKATTAAEILEAREQADIAYTAAKKTARLKKIKEAHGDVLAACRKTMGDALMIEARAQCRLAEEYDAAQERGEVAKRSDGTAIRDHVPNKNKVATVTDIGITRKQVHEARIVRDAEKAKPGIVRKTIEARLEANEEPTRADVKRAVTGGRPKSNSSRGRQPRAPKRHYKEDSIVALADKGLTHNQIAAETGIGKRQVRHVVEREKIRREAKAEPQIDRSDLSMTAQEKFDAAVRQHARKLDLQFEQRVRDEIRKRMDEIILPHWKEQIGEAKNLYTKRKGLMDKETFNTIRRGLHPDSRNSISDKKLGEAFDTFMALEKYLLNEKDSPTAWPDMPSSAEEWDKMKQAATAARKAKRTAGQSAIRPRS